MQLIPEKLSRLELDTSEKRFITNLRKSLEENITMVGGLVNDTGNMFHMIISEFGIICIEKYKISDLENSIEILKNAHLFNNMKVNQIRSKLLRNKNLKVELDDEEYLKFPVSYKMLITDHTEETIIGLDLEDEEIDSIFNEVIFYDSLKYRPLEQIYSISKNEESIKYVYDKKIDKEMITDLLQALAPEYVIALSNKMVSEEETCCAIVDKDILNDDYYVRSFRLDEEQLSYINQIKKGHQLILACAGSGKSVLLLSKAYKIAALNPNEKFLLTCYNKNLKQAYNWKIGVAGFRERNMEALTFHKLLMTLLQSHKMSYNANDTEGNFNRVRNAIDQGKIKPIYRGIFIDEIQVFKPEWYELCYDLLIDKKDEYFLSICGDISQNINKNINKRNVPWRGNDSLPKYTGRSMRLTKNYRNTVQISQFSQKFTQEAKEFFAYNDIDEMNDEEAFLIGEPFKLGNDVNLIDTDRSKVVEEVINEITRINEECGIPLSEIAVIFPYRKYGPLKYNFMYWLENRLEELDMNYCSIISKSQQNVSNYANRSGVTLTTIDSALGLDFDAVILAGLLPLGHYHKSNRFYTYNSGKVSEECEQDLIENVNKIYTAATRAREQLSIILDEKDSESVYSMLIKNAYY